MWRVRPPRLLVPAILPTAGNPSDIGNSGHGVWRARGTRGGSTWAALKGGWGHLPKFRAERR